MARVAARQWREIVQRLDELIDSAENSALPLEGLGAFHIRLRLMEFFEGLPASPRAVWKYLISEERVPHKVFEKCQQLQLSCSMHVLAEPCLHAVVMFLRGAHEAGVVPSSGSNSLTLSIGQQLEQAGLLRMLPLLIAHTSERLTAMQNSPAEVAAELASGYSIMLDPAEPLSNSDLTFGRLACLHTHLWALLQVLVYLQHLWPEQRCEACILPDLCLPLTELYLSTMQHISLCLDQMPVELQQPPPCLGNVLTKLHASMSLYVMPCWQPLLYTAESELGLLQKQVLSSPSTLQSLGLLTLVTAYADMLQHQYGGSTSNATTSCSSTAPAAPSGTLPSSTDPQQQQHGQPEGGMAIHLRSRSAWEFASSSHDLLPLAHDELLRALSCTSKETVWLASLLQHHVGGAGSPTVMSALVRCAVVAYKGAVQLRAPWVEKFMQTQKQTMLLDTLTGLMGGRQGIQQQQVQGLQWSPGEHAMHLLLPSVLLRWAANMPTSRAGFAEACFIAGECGISALQGWRQQQDLQSAHQVACWQKRLQDPLQLNSVIGFGDFSQSPDLDPVFLQIKEALPLALCAMQKLLHACAGAAHPNVSDSKESSSTGHMPGKDLGKQRCVESCSNSGGSRAGSSSRHRSSRSHPSGRSSTAGSSSSGVDQVVPSMSGPTALQALANYLCVLSDSPVGVLQAERTIRSWFNPLPLTPVASERLSGSGYSDQCGLTRSPTGPDLIAQGEASNAAAWSEHAVQLCSVLEAYVRLSASLPMESGGSLADNDAGLPLLCSRFVQHSSYWHNGGLLQAALAAGPGSSHAAQLFSVLCSLVKFGRKLPSSFRNRVIDGVLAATLSAASILQAAAGPAAGPPHGAEDISSVGLSSPTASDPACVAVSTAVHAAQHSLPGPSAREGPAAFGDTGAVSAPEAGRVTAGPTGSELEAAACKTAAGVTLINAGLKAATAGLPWLVMFGRCCISWAEQLQLWPGTPAAAIGPQSAFFFYFNFRSSLDIFLKPVLGEGIFTSCIYSCQEWIGDDSVAVQLAGLGYPVTQVQQSLQSAAAADLTAAAQAAAGVAPAEAILHMVQQLQALGLVLNTLPISNACNNPACSNLSQSSELKLVKGSQRCAGCRTARYCSKHCITQHWKQHKPVCKAVAAAMQRPLSP